VQLQAIEKAFHNDNGLLASHGGTMQIEDNLGFGESRGESISGLAAIHRSAVR